MKILLYSLLFVIVFENCFSQNDGKLIWERFILTNNSYSIVENVSMLSDGNAVFTGGFNDAFHSAVIKVNVEKGEFGWTQDNIEEFPVLLKKVKQFSDGSINAIGFAYPSDTILTPRPYLIKLNQFGDKLSSYVNTLENYAVSDLALFQFDNNLDKFYVVSVDSKNNRLVNFFKFGSSGELQLKLQIPISSSLISKAITQNDQGDLLLSIQSDSLRTYLVDTKNNLTLTSVIFNNFNQCFLTLFSSGYHYLFSKSQNGFSKYDVIDNFNKLKITDNVVSVPETLPNYFNGLTYKRVNYLVGYNQLISNKRDKRFLISGFDEDMKSNFQFSFGKSNQNNILNSIIKLSEKEFLVVGERGFENDSITKMMYLARVSLGVKVGVKDVNLNSSQTMLYPNPTSNSISILTDSKFNLIEVYNSIGIKVFSTSEKRIDVSELSNGTYFMKLISNDFNDMKSFIVKK